MAKFQFYHYQESQHSQTTVVDYDNANGFYHYQESQHSQTSLNEYRLKKAFYHYQESQHSQTSNCIFMQRFSASVSAYTRRRGS